MAIKAVFDTNVLVSALLNENSKARKILNLFYDKEILIYYYVAYTDFSDSDDVSSGTLRYPSIDVIITQENVKDYLSYMDKFKYTFEKSNDGNFYFKSIEYVNE